MLDLLSSEHKSMEALGLTKLMSTADLSNTDLSPCSKTYIYRSPAYLFYIHLPVYVSCQHVDHRHVNYLAHMSIANLSSCPDNINVTYSHSLLDMMMNVVQM